MKEFTEYMLQNSLVFGVIAIAISIALFIYMITSKESSKMKDHDVMSWKSYVDTWVFIAILFLIGMHLLLK